jgi:hypothetical protein
MPNTPTIIKNLEKARRLAFSDFEKIELEPSAVKVLINFFLHPGCKSDISLATFLTDNPVRLFEVSSHIITAFPSQLAMFAKRKEITKIADVDLLECFAIDHADVVEENQASLLFEPSYALAHVLTIGTVANTRNTENRHLVDLQVKVCDKKVKFSHVLVPANITVKKGQTVFHHFGVVVASADTKELKSLAKKLQKEQNKKTFLQEIVRQVLGKNIEDIDYAKEAFFKVDMAGQIIKESKKDFDFFQLWQKEDLKKIKIPKTEKVMFNS